jgi:hypothetical protein
MKYFLLLCLALSACGEDDERHGPQHPAEVVKVATSPDGISLYRVWDEGRPIYFASGVTITSQLEGKITHTKRVCTMDD